MKGIILAGGAARIWSPVKISKHLKAITQPQACIFKIINPSVSLKVLKSARAEFKITALNRDYLNAVRLHIESTLKL